MQQQPNHHFWCFFLYQLQLAEQDADSVPRAIQDWRFRGSQQLEQQQQYQVYWHLIARQEQQQLHRVRLDCRANTDRSSLSTGALAGIIVAVVVGLLLLLFLILFFCCRRRIKDSIAHRRLKKDRKKNRANLDLYEDTGGMAMSNARNGGVSLRDHEGAAAISPFLAPGPDASRPSMQSDTNMYGAGGYHAPSHYSSQPNFADGAAAGAWPQAATMSSSGSSQGYHEPMYSASSSSSYHEPMYGGGARAAPTKAQLAMSNPDEVLRDPTQPQMYAPPGGFRRHEDAGSFGAPPAPEVEDLPPTYNPQWEQSSQSSRPEKGPL